MKFLITGATGLIGQQLCQSLRADGHSINVLSRSARQDRAPFADQVFAWAPETETPPAAAFDQVDTVIHLAGETVAALRWNDEKKRRIRDSRVLGTRNLVAAMRALPRKPATLIVASAVGYYGTRGDELLTEQAAPGKGFLADVCVEWERESLAAAQSGMRVALLRIGVVLSPAGGALAQMLPPFRMGVAGKLGSGAQWFPWIHVDDVIGLFRHVIDHGQISGPVNIVAPGAITNAGFTRTLAQALHRPAFLAAPEFVLRALLGEVSDILLISHRVVPQVALDTGYKFRYSELPKALASLLK
ncbi:MAG: TIGR01777 family oxidoreductase [Blastocatellia bacterium]